MVRETAAISVGRFLGYRRLMNLDDTVRNGFEAIRVTFHVQGAAEAEALARLVDQARRRSAVYDVLTNGVPVTVDVATA